MGQRCMTCGRHSKMGGPLLHFDNCDCLPDKASPKSVSETAQKIRRDIQSAGQYNPEDFKKVFGDPRLGVSVHSL